MLVANSFDLWQKDAFFSAAEEVQHSADIMESAYRTWMREKKEGLKHEDLDELCRELKTALGTAKWQLEEFERAVKSSHETNSDNNMSAQRHKQFVTAIEDQISRVESSLKESYNEEGKQPLRWISLDEEERDDLAIFLSGASSNDHIELGPTSKTSQKENPRRKNNIPKPKIKGFKDMVSINKDSKYLIELEGEQIPRTRDDMSCQTDKTGGTRRTWSSPNFGALRIVISDQDEERHELLPSIESTPKEKGYKPGFWNQNGGEHPNPKITRLNQLFGRVGGFQRQLQSPLQLQFSCSIQFTLAFMITIFLILPFVLYST